MIRRPPRSTLDRSSAASDVYKRQSLSSVLVGPMSGLIQAGKLIEVIRLWRETTRKCMLLFVPACFGFVVISHQLIHVLFTEQYDAAVPVFRIYTGLILLRVLNGQIVLQGLGKTHAVTWLTGLFLVMNVALNVLSVKALDLGIEGPAWATVVSYAVVGVVGSIWAQTVLGVKFKSYFCLRTFAEVFVSAAFAAGVAGALGYWLGEGSVFVALILKALVYLIVFSVCGAALRLYSRDDMRLLLFRGSR